MDEKEIVKYLDQLTNEIDHFNESANTMHPQPGNILFAAAVVLIKQQREILELLRLTAIRSGVLPEIPPEGVPVQETVPPSRYPSERPHLVSDVPNILKNGPMRVPDIFEAYKNIFPATEELDFMKLIEDLEVAGKIKKVGRGFYSI